MQQGFDGNRNGAEEALGNGVRLADRDRARFAVLPPRGRIWAIAAVRGDVERLRSLQDQVSKAFQRGDRVIFLGDFFGAGPDNLVTIDEILNLRRWVLSHGPFTHPDDFVVLRGAQEEMWRMLLQIQFASNPDDVLQWMESRGVARIVEAYGGNFAEGVQAARSGPIALNHWASGLRAALRRTDGHVEFNGSLLRAAIGANGALLFVNAGLDPDRPLDAQGDRFWWNPGGLQRMKAPYRNAKLVVRGTDPDRSGIVSEQYWISIDGGCGEGGPLNAICLSAEGEVLEAVTC